MSHRDAITGKTRTWPYGTTKLVEVLEVAPDLCICADAEKEGYVLIGGDGDERTAKPGDVGTITFVAGGPTGGFWRYTANSRLGSN